MGKHREAVSLLLAICFLTVAIHQGIADPAVSEDTLCYGFVVSPIACKNSTIENQINCKIKHMVNDLLREQIPVYWTTTNITILTNEMKQLFEKGTFIIPFTGKDTADTKLTAIIYDYNQSSEIEENNEIKIPIYEIMEPLTTPTYQLVEVKIALFKSQRTSGESFYLDAAGKNGFLTFEMLEDKDLAKQLNNTAFNVVIWPAGDSYYCNRLHKLFSTGFFEAVSGLSSDRYNIIREFVGNGGGYIGSCYGAYVASCGVLPVPISLKRRAYNPNLSSYGILAISDVLTVPIMKLFGTIHECIVDDTHPVTYGVGPILIDGHMGGPRFVRVGKNSQIIATFYNTSKILDGTPSWISSAFGNGKVMLFSGHPEFIDSDVYPYFMPPAVDEYYVGKEIISNTLYYTTSKEIAELNTSESRPLSFVFETWENTSDLIDTFHKTENVFEEIKTNITQTLDEITDLINEINLSVELIRNISYEVKISVDTNSPTFLGYFSACFTIHYLNLFIKYLENILKTLNTLEMIYPLLQHDGEFIHQIESLKTDMLTKINETKDILTKGHSICEEYEGKLQAYQQNQKLSRIKENNIHKKAHELRKQIASGFQYVPQVYFDSLKCLRHNWYNYESIF